MFLRFRYSIVIASCLMILPRTYLVSSDISCHASVRQRPFLLFLENINKKIKQSIESCITYFVFHFLEYIYTISRIILPWGAIYETCKLGVVNTSKLGWSNMPAIFMTRTDSQAM